MAALDGISLSSFLWCFQSRVATCCWWVVTPILLAQNNKAHAHLGKKYRNWYIYIYILSCFYVSCHINIIYDFHLSLLYDSVTLRYNLCSWNICYTVSFLVINCCRYKMLPNWQNVYIKSWKLSFALQIQKALFKMCIFCVYILLSFF